MSSLLLSIVVVAGLPTPHFATTLPLPTPKFMALPVVVLPPVIEPASNVLTRLPGPRDHFRCSHCGRSDCLMFLGDHLLRVHSQSYDYVDQIGYQQFGVLHDNLHNANYQPGSAPKQNASCPTCEGGQCRRPILNRFFSRWRK